MRRFAVLFALVATITIAAVLPAAANGWAPDWSPNGRYLASGLGDLSLCNYSNPSAPVCRDLGLVGWGPKWTDDNHFVFTDGASGLSQFTLSDGTVTQIRVTGFNELAAGGGQWAGWRPNLIDTSIGVSFSGAGSPAMNAAGALAYVTPRDALVKAVMVGGVAVRTCGCSEVSYSRQVAVWTQAEAPSGTWFLTPGSTPQKAKTPQPAEEYRPIAIDTPEGPWIGNHTQTGLIVRVASATDARGYRWDNGGEAYYPAWTYRDGALWAAFSNHAGVLGVHVFALNAPREDLSASPAGDVPWTGTAPIDLTPFVVGDDASWPRTGSHDMDRAWDGRNLYWLKFGALDHWERWVLDGDSWYLREDRSQSGAGDYSFHPGRWFPRVWQLGGVINASDNYIQRYDAASCRVTGTGAFPYRLQFVAAWSRIALGGSIGTITSTDDGPIAVLLEYDPGGDADTYERGLFVKGWGSTRWQLFDQKTNALLNQTEWPSIGGAHVPITNGCYRAFTGSAAHPSITITTYGPTTGRAPLTWEASASTSGQVDVIVWRWRLRGASSWTTKYDDTHTTVTLTQPGEYEIGVDAYGPGGSDGTSTPRIVKVTP